MNLIKILITTVAVTLHLSSVCQDKICVDKHVAVKLAKQLDSLETLKKLEVQYIAYKDTCMHLTQKQAEVIKTQSFLLDNKAKEIGLLNDKFNDCQSIIKVNEDLLQQQKKINKQLKTKFNITLIGGTILSLGFTTALILVLI